MDFYSTALAQGLAFAPLALGIFLSMRILNLPDITTDGSYTLGAVVAAVIVSNNLNPLLTVFLVPAAGMLSGMATGYIHTKLNVHPLLSGIIVMTALYSINLLILSQPNMPLLNKPNLFSTLALATDPFLNKLMVLAALAAIIILTLNYYLRTDAGLVMRGLGNSELMLRANGVDTQQVKVYGLAIANSLAALSGALMAQYQGFADVNMGIGIVISGLAAVMMGEAAFDFFKYGRLLLKITLAVCGAIVFRLILAIALAAGLNPNYLKLITALMVLTVVSLSFLKNNPLKKINYENRPTPDQ